MIYITCISEFLIRIYADINRKHFVDKRKTSDSGSIFIVIIGLFGNTWLSFLLSKNNMPWLVSKLNLPHFFYFIGLTLMLGGLVLRAVSVLTLRKYFTVLVQVTSEQQLIQNGVYKRLRNPSYAGMLLFIVGVAISLRSAISAILSLIIFTLCVSIRIKVEEKALRENFGSEFDEYCAHTWRLIPFIW
jgi:protein-S-isoprenylcysteine O-methyltransferase Ste14